MFFAQNSEEKVNKVVDSFDKEAQKPKKAKAAFYWGPKEWIKATTAFFYGPSERAIDGQTQRSTGWNTFGMCSDIVTRFWCYLDIKLSILTILHNIWQFSF